MLIITDWMLSVIRPREREERKSSKERQMN